MMGPRYPFGLQPMATFRNYERLETRGHCQSFRVQLIMIGPPKRLTVQH